MPYGFMGKACQKFLSTVADAMESADEVLSQDPFEGLMGSADEVLSQDAFKNLMTSADTVLRINHPAVGLSGSGCPPRVLPASTLLYTPDTAMDGGYRTGVGNQSNIVVKQDTYEHALHKAHMIDAKISEDFHSILVQIEEMCATVYILPDTLPKVLSVTDKIQTSLEEFQSLTDEAVLRMRRFVNEIMVLDGQ